MKAIPAISAPAAISPSSSTLPLFEFDVAVEAAGSFVLVVDVGAVVVGAVVVDPCLPPLVSSLKALPPAALPAPAVEVAATADAPVVAAEHPKTAHRHTRQIRNLAVSVIDTQSRISLHTLRQRARQRPSASPHRRRPAGEAPPASTAWLPISAQTVE